MMSDDDPSCDEALVRYPEQGKNNRKIWIVVAIGVLVIAVVIATVVFCKLRNAHGSYLFHHPNVEVIRFDPFNETTYNGYADLISAKLEAYLPQHQENIKDTIDCTTSQVPSGNQQCYFDLALLGSRCTPQNNYGFSDGEPCILLELRTPENWTPDNFDVNGTVPEGTNIVPDHIGISCIELPKKPKGQQTMKVKYYPESGFPIKFFPANSTSHLAPLVMAQFFNLPDSLYVGIQCQAWAANTKSTYFQTYFQIFVK